MHLFSNTTLSDLRQQVEADGPKSADWRRLLSRVDAWCLSQPELPNQSGGWIHNYICPTHWLPLVYDGDKPTEHNCPAGDSCVGAVYDEAWLAWRHRQIADMSREVALAYVMTGKADYLAEVERVLLHYAAFYANSVGADSAESWMITARVFNQALTEALWAVPLIHAFDLVADSLTADVRTQIENDFLRPFGETMAKSQEALIEKDNVASNYMAWFNAAMGCLGYALSDSTLIERAIDGAGGFVKHLDVGVLADGMQYEVTPYYHNFVVLAYQILAEAALANGRDLYAVKGEQGQSIQSMWRALTKLTLPDGTIADLGDGSYWIDSVYDRELYEVYEIAVKHDDDAAVADIMRNAYARSGNGRDHWAALLFGHACLAKPVESGIAPTGWGVKVLANAGTAMLTASSKLVGVAPFGAYRGSHSHGDQLSLQVWPFSNDAGCVLYGVTARREWYQDCYAHNTLVIDGLAPRTFQSADHNIDKSCIELISVDAFAADVTRTVSAGSARINDELVVSAETSHQFDWVFHVDGTLTPNGQTVLTSIEEKAGDSAAGQQILLTERADGLNSAEFTISHKNQTYTLSLSGDASFDLLLGSAPGTSWNPTERRHVIIGRTIGQAQTYSMTITHD